jgi:hypothetical protein
MVREHLGECAPCHTFFAGMNGVGEAVKLAARQESQPVPPALLSAFEDWAATPSRGVATIPGRVADYAVIAATFVLSLVLAFVIAPDEGMGAMALGRALICSGTHAVGALLPAALVFALGAKRLIGRAPRLVGVAAAVGALGVQIVDHCPSSSHVQHQLAFHTGAVLLTVALVISVTRMLQAARVRVG